MIYTFFPTNCSTGFENLSNEVVLILNEVNIVFIRATNSLQNYGSPEEKRVAIWKIKYFNWHDYYKNNFKT